MQRYSRLLDRYPSLTRIVTTGSLFWLGDVLSQGIERRGMNKPFDWHRNVRFTGFGTLVAAPMFIGYYNKFLPTLFPGAGAGTVGRKVLFDQTVWAASFITFLFYALARLEGRAHGPAWSHASANVWPSLKVNWMVWPGVMFLNFYVVPLKFQILVVNVVALFWNTFLSYRNSL